MLRSSSDRAGESPARFAYIDVMRRNHLQGVDTHSYEELV
jgi:hypothetical protein